MVADVFFSHLADTLTAQLDAGLTSQDGGEFLTAPLGMRGAVLQGGLVDEPIEGVCQFAGHLGGTPRAGAIHQALDSLVSEAMAPLAQRGIGQVQRVRHHWEAVPLDDCTHRLGTAVDTGFLRLLQQSIQGGERLLGKVECEGPQCGGLQEIRLQKCPGGHSP